MLVSCNPRTTLENEKVSKQFVFGGTMCFELDIRSVLVSSHSFSLFTVFPVQYGAVPPRCPVPLSGPDKEMFIAFFFSAL